MKLGVLERIKLSSVLPDSGSYQVLKAIRNLRMKLNFSDDEKKLLNFKGIMKCSVCGITNVQSVQKFALAWEKGDAQLRRLIPTREKLEERLDLIYNRNTCFDCKAPAHPTGNVIWKKVEEKGKWVPLEKVIRIPDFLKVLITKGLVDWEKEDKLDDSLVSLYEKFVGKPE